MNFKKKKNNEELIQEYQNASTEREKKKIADELYKKNYKLVVKYAGTMPAVYYGTQDDLIQEASAIFMRCIKKFDTTKNIKFSTYFGRACGYELPRYKNKLRKHVDNSYFLEIDEILTSKPDNIEDKIDDSNNIMKIQKVLVKLHKEQKITNKQFNTIIEEHGLLGKKKKNRKEIALEQGCSIQNVGFLYRKAINRIKEEMGELSITKGDNNG